MSVLTKERRLVTGLPGPASQALAARRRAAVSSAVSVGNDIYIDHGDGAILVDVDGNQLIDFGSGIAVASVGHAAPAVVAAVSEQAARFAHTCFMVNPYPGYVEVCEKLNEHTPGDHEKRSALFNSGAEAVENAVKIARAATGRQAVVAFDHAYHGRTNLTMALTAKVQPYKDGFGPFAPEVYRMGMAYPYRWPGGPERCAEEAFAEFTSRVHVQVGEEHVAAVLLEPIQGEGGFIVPAPGFLKLLSEWCAAHGVVFIADEVQTGFCRTGDWFASEFEGIVPDLVTTAKAMGGGLPLAAVTGRAELMDAPVVGGLGGTFGGNPISCAAALAAIGMMEADDLAGRARQIGGLLTSRLGELAAAHPQIGEIRGRGAMVAVEIVAPDGTKTPDAALTKALLAGCARRGVVMLGCGTFGNVIRMLPPLVIDDALVEDAMNVLADSFAQALA
ncbi:MAG: 4-aminobutyrate--2-oxoglutarate transaminase [Propionicimonas sp.]|uniref:4-aminobutyrate--2-oxoglutarate transaminase n=1 Tax=Propionicimonas sp. TaxID=1955623 RepID=UPI003D0A0C17